MIQGARSQHSAYLKAQQLCNERRLSEAMGVLKNHLRKNRDDAASLGLLGVLHADMGEYAEGRRVLKKALRLMPKSADLHCRYGRILAKENQLDQAADAFKTALKLAPGHPWAMRCLVDVLVGLHRGEEANELLREAMKRAPETPDFLIAHQRVAGVVGEHEQGLRSADLTLQLPDLPLELKVQTLFNKGGFLAKLGRHDEAFEAYRDANEVAPVPYNAVKNRTMTDRLIEVWTRDRIEEVPASTRKADYPVFIVGMPRSGTTLVEQIAASHPKVFGAGELPTITQMVSTFNDNDPDPISFLTDLSKLSKQNVENASKHYLESLRKKAPGAARITDKMPDNFRALGMISKLFPGARVIHCHRDARDNCLSVYSLYFTGKGNGFAYDLEDLGGFYADYWRLMKHWKSVLDIPILDVSYEAMVADTESMSRRLIDFLGLEWDDRCLEFHKTKRIARTLSSDQVNKPIYKSSVARWKPYEQHLGPLLERLPADAMLD